MADDWLPPDWRVEVRVRKSGKKDKFYIQSSTGVKLFSKPEVLRYLHKKANICELQEKGKMGIEGSNKTMGNGSGPDGFLIPTAQSQAENHNHRSEELPPGWIKSIKVTNSGGKTRKDSYYTDPVDGYIFRSKREAFRYLKTRELGRRVIKPKDRNNEDHTRCAGRAKVVLSNPNMARQQGLIVPENVGQFLAHPEWNRQMPPRNGNIKLKEVVEDDQTIESTCTNDLVSLVKHTRNPYNEVNAAIKSFNQAEEAKVWSGMDLSRPASKRLGGIRIDSLGDLGNKALADRRASIGQVKGKAGSTIDNPLDLDSIANNESEEVKKDDPMSYLMMDPCIEFAVKLLRDEISIEDSIEMVFGRPRGKEPSIDFGVKTSTGAFPLNNGGGGGGGSGSKQQQQ